MTDVISVVICHDERDLFRRHDSGRGGCSLLDDMRDESSLLDDMRGGSSLFDDFSHLIETFLSVRLLSVPSDHTSQHTPPARLTLNTQQSRGRRTSQHICSMSTEAFVPS